MIVNRNTVPFAPPSYVYGRYSRLLKRQADGSFRGAYKGLNNFEALARLSGYRGLGDDADPAPYNADWAAPDWNDPASYNTEPAPYSPQEPIVDSQGYVHYPAETGATSVGGNEYTYQPRTSTSSNSGAGSESGGSFWSSLFTAAVKQVGQPAGARPAAAAPAAAFPVWVIPVGIVGALGLGFLLLKD